MKAIGKTVQDILTSLSEERIEPFNNLHDVIMQNLPKDFEAAISYGGLGYVIPHSVYPAGYHCKPIEPLPFAGIASQKNSINFTTWVSIQIQNFWNGSCQNILSIASKN
jgi:hypothetical protein